jgi:hypothetical protein
MVASRRKQSDGGGDSMADALTTLRDEVRTGAERLLGAAKEVGEEAKAKAMEAKETVQEETTRLISEQKERVAGRVDTLASAIDQAARVLRAAHVDQVATFAEEAAERIDDVYRYLQERDVADLGEDVADLARRHPLPFIGGLIVAGLAIGRLAKAGHHAAANDEPSSGARARSGSSRGNRGGRKRNASRSRRSE